MQSVAGSRIMWLGILVSALVTGIPAQFGWVATAGTIGTADVFSQPGQGSNNINGPLSPELPRQSSTRPSRWQLPLAAAWISGRTTRQAFGSMTE